jgi:hypothetical protein
MLVFALTPLGAMRLIDAGTMPARIAAVIVGAGGILPWLWVAATMIHRGDEFQRRIHLIAAAWAFAGSIVLIVTLHWLVLAEFIPPPNLLFVWFGFLLLWLIAIIVTKRRFEHGR